MHTQCILLASSRISTTRIHTYDSSRMCIQYTTTCTIEGALKRVVELYMLYECTHLLLYKSTSCIIFKIILIFERNC